MEADRQPESEPYDETVEAARMLEEIDQSSGGAPKQAPEGSEVSKTEGAVAAAPGEQASPAPASEGERETETSIGELFSNLVKMSPPDKIRVEKGSIGFVFKKYIEK